MQNHETKRDTAVVSGATTAVYSMGIVIFAQTRNHTRRRFIPRFRLPEEQRISCKQGQVRQTELSRRLSYIDGKLLVRLLSVIGFIQL